MVVVVGIDPYKADRIQDTPVLLHDAGGSRPGDLLVRGTSRHHPARGGNRRLCDAQHRIAVTPTLPMVSVRPTSSAGASRQTSP